ncbi:hypothetical protein C21_04623 [Arenibacter sp. NBRC 103722]|uniref:hypothetical protein n=1 Tax=Arenibacter sp. NBRC 103722 TaxID=1113929 RepID=UPI000856B8D4|nr:hypothetical protein [Arenibacter sp. NBRC 103722]GBF22428.1 hypothetical protein C21_04623 [Arenibacter sp. NBRC 103722]
MRTKTFNQEMKRMLTGENHPVLRYMNEKFKNGRIHNNYYVFFDNFLFEYGILSLGFSPVLSGNKYFPYAHCSKNNIFGAEKGTTYLSNKAHNSSQCEKILAEYLIEHLKYLNINHFENWNPELNY